MAKQIIVRYSYRLYEGQELTVPDDFDLNDEDAVRVALEAQQQFSFTEDSELQIDNVREDES